MSDGTGWRDSIELAPAATFPGADAERTARLDLNSLHERLAEIRAATGVANTTYNLDVVADIRTTGTLHGQRLDVDFRPRLQFRLDAVRLSLRDTTTDGESSLTSATSGRLTVEDRAPRRLELGSARIAIGSLRHVGILLALVGTIAALAARHGMSRRLPDGAARIALRHRSRLIGVNLAEIRDGTNVFDVTKMDDLVRLAEQHATLILHERTVDFDTYHFVVDGAMYRHRQRRARRSVAAV